MVDHDAMNEMIRTIILAKKEIGGIKEAWFRGRKNGEVDELKKTIERLNEFVKRQEAELKAAHEKIAQLERQLKPRDPFKKRAGPYD